MKTLLVLLAFIIGYSINVKKEAIQSKSLMNIISQNIAEEITKSSQFSEYVQHPLLSITLSKNPIIFMNEELQSYFKNKYHVYSYEAGDKTFTFISKSSWDKMSSNSKVEIINSILSEEFLKESKKSALEDMKNEMSKEPEFLI